MFLFQNISIDHWKKSTNVSWSTLPVFSNSPFTALPYLACGIGLLVPATHQHSWSRGVSASRYPQDPRGTDRVQRRLVKCLVKGRLLKSSQKDWAGILRQKKKAERKNQEKRGDVDYVTPKKSLTVILWKHRGMPISSWGDFSHLCLSLRLGELPTILRLRNQQSLTIHGMIIQAWLLAFLGLVALEYGSIDMCIYMNALWVCRIACANQKPGGYLKIDHVLSAFWIPPFFLG